MKINILAEMREGAWGGGNQFLKALRKEFIAKGVYEEAAEKADLILFNSFPFRQEYRFRQIAKLKKSGKLIVHRVDGPISEIRGSDLDIDLAIFAFNNLFADGTVFQSAWSRAENVRLGMKSKPFETIVSNAPDAAIFNRAGKTAFNKEKVKLIATSWSSNPRKGFAIYSFLDENLDFSRYQMDFFGNSSVSFKNIIQHQPVDSRALATALKQSDIFITASQKDPCSNSLIEALSCGLPAVGLNDGGHPEIIGTAGEVFTSQEDILAKIDEVAEDYAVYQARIALPSIGQIAEKYYNFMDQVYQAAANGTYRVKAPSPFSYYCFLSRIYFRKIKDLLAGKFKALRKK